MATDVETSRHFNKKLAVRRTLADRSGRAVNMRPNLPKVFPITAILRDCRAWQSPGCRLCRAATVIARLPASSRCRRVCAGAGKDGSGAPVTAGSIPRLQRPGRTGRRHPGRGGPGRRNPLSRAGPPGAPRNVVPVDPQAAGRGPHAEQGVRLPGYRLRRQRRAADTGRAGAGTAQDRRGAGRRPRHDPAGPLALQQGPRPGTDRRPVPQSAFWTARRTSGAPAAPARPAASRSPSRWPGAAGRTAGPTSAGSPFWPRPPQSAI